jgi:thiol:disulfide interchange protein DsbD
MIQRSFFLVTAFLLALAAGVALAAPLQDDGPVAVRAVVQHPAVEQGGKLVIAVVLDHKSGYHTWPAAEVELPKTIEFAIRTEITLPIDEKAQDAAKKAATDAKKPDAEIEAIRVFATPSWVMNLDGVQFPEAHKGKVADPSGTSDKPLNVPLYSGKAIAFMRVQVKPDAPIGEKTFNVRVAYQSCNEQTCTMPQDLTVPVTIKVVKSGEKDAGLTKDNEAALFATFNGKWTTATGAAPVTAPRVETPAPKPDPAPAPAPKKDSNHATVTPVPSNLSPPDSASATPVNGSFFGFNIGSSALVLGLFGIIGGVLLNLTPCVLPVIPIKVMSLTQHAASKRHAFVLGVWMALGVVAFWTAAGIPMAIISRGLDPSRFIFGVWWVTLIIGMIIALMGLGIMGLFNINLPQSVYMIETKADSPTGSFMFGVLTAVLGLPCFGFVVGGLLAGAATLPWFAILAVFVGLGVGMAAPYLLLAVRPELLRFIPRTGPASELVKQVMGILLIAAAAYFIAAGVKAVTSDYPYLEGSIAWWAVAFFIAIAGLWLIIRTFQITKSAVRRISFVAVAVAMVVGIGMFAKGKFADDRKNYEALAAAMKKQGPSTAVVPSGVWMKYTPELLASVRASGRSVFLDFTADWCINCKALRRLLLDRDPVLARLTSTDIVLMEVDCTSTRAPGWDLLKELNRTGVPTWAVYGPDTKGPPVVIDLTTPTSQTVLDAINRAGVPAQGSPQTSASR